MMEMEENEDRLLQRIVFVLQSLNPSHYRNIDSVAFTRTPIRIRQRLAIQLIQRRLIHHSYLHTLTLLAYGEMPGEVLLDQLLQLDSDIHFLEDYLVLITLEQASKFVHFATSAFMKTSTSSKLS